MELPTNKIGAILTKRNILIAAGILVLFLLLIIGLFGGKKPIISPRSAPSAPVFDFISYTSDSKTYTIAYPGWWIFSTLNNTDVALSNGMGTARVIVLFQPKQADAAVLGVMAEALRRDQAYVVTKIEQAKIGEHPAYRATGMHTEDGVQSYFAEVGVLAPSGLYRLRSERDVASSEAYDDLLSSIVASFHILK